MQRIAVIAAVAVSLGAWSARAAPTNIKSVEAAAHGAYVAAINSNDTETLMADLTDDIVYQVPSEPEIVGNDAVRKWVVGYFDAYRTTWEKTSIGFTVIGGWPSTDGVPIFQSLNNSPRLHSGVRYWAAS